MEISEKSIAAVSAAVVAITGAKPMWGALKAVAESMRRKKDKTTYLQQLVYVRDIHAQMKSMRVDTASSRVIVFAGHNGGGLPRAGSRYYTTALHWDVDADFEQVMQEYKNIPVDCCYINMLLEAEQNDFYHFKTAQEPDSKLRRYYEAEGVTESLIYYLDLCENSFIYASVATHDAKGFNAADLARIEVLACALKEIVKKSNKAS